jgi:DNA adenine methylase
MSIGTKPFLKWAGSKYKIIDKIVESLPNGSRLIEPFVGSGAVFLNTDYPAYIAADVNPDLINLYRCIQSGGFEFIDRAKLLFVEENNREESFYKLRKEFNETADIFRKSELFIYLNRHCFNGLCRYNSKGGFNVPFGKYSSPTFPEAEIANFFHKSQIIDFKVSDFVETMERAKVGDVVYCDPPYAPLTKTANFTSYTKSDFTLERQEQLSSIAVKLMNKGITVIISNHDTEFTRSIYNVAKIDCFDVQRFISSNATTRTKAPELLAIFSGGKDVLDYIHSVDCQY